MINSGLCDDQSFRVGMCYLHNGQPITRVPALTIDSTGSDNPSLRMEPLPIKLSDPIEVPPFMITPVLT